MKSPFASCCLLSYNRPEFVREAIISCVAEAGHPLEMIVHDDGSNIETEAVLRELRDAGLISLLMMNAPTHNEGQGVALNRMFAAAKGDPIVKLDHDLVFEKGWLRECVDLLEANRGESDDLEALAVKFPGSVGPHGPPRIGALGLFKYEHDPVDWRQTLVATRMTTDGIEWEQHTDFVGSAMVIPRVAWEEFGPFEERSPAFAEDAEFKRWIEEREGWCNALFPRDLARNVGFGPGPSTVVSQNGSKVEVTKIHEGPKVLG